MKVSVTYYRAAKYSGFTEIIRPEIRENFEGSFFELRKFLYERNLENSFRLIMNRKVRKNGVLYPSAKERLYVKYL